MTTTIPENRSLILSTHRFGRKAGALLTLAMALWLVFAAEPATAACSSPVGAFCVDYFQGKAVGGAVLFSAVETGVNHNWGWGSPGPAVPVDGYSGRWQGQFDFDGNPVIFRVKADDGVRLKVDGVVLIDGWKDQGATEYKATAAPAAGRHLVEVEYYEGTGQAVLEAGWTPAPNCDLPVGQFCASYYKNTGISGYPVAVAHEAAIAHNWGWGSPNPAVPADRFSGRWQGQFDFDGNPVIFRVKADDGVRLKVDGVVLIDGWKDQGATEYKATAAPAAGRHLVEVEYYEGTGQAVLEAGWTPAPNCDLPVGQFCVSYYNNTGISGYPVAVAHEAAIAHNWGRGSPGAGVPADNFSGRWQGTFDFTEGTYEFATTSDDGVRLWVDDQLVIDFWSAQAGVSRKAQLALSGPHRITVDYFEGGGEASLQAGWALLPPASPPPSVSAHATVGANLSDWRDWSTEQPFLDVFKTSRRWITQSPTAWDTGESAKLDLDANGWVRSLPDGNDPNVRYRSVVTLMLHGGDLNGPRQGGEYVVLYEGEGRIQYNLGARKIDAKSAPGRDVIYLDPNHYGGIQLNIVQTDPNHTGDYLRNIRVIVPGKVCDDDALAYCASADDAACGRAACRTTEAAAADRMFHPLFLRTLKNYTSLRFMAPQNTNIIDSGLTQPSEWTQRNTLDSARWVDQAGIPAEVAVALANQTQTDPWLNLPHRASDDYIRQFARLVKAQLGPDRKVYVEYANEIWNTAFSAGSWVEQQALAAWPSSAESPYTKRINWYGQRTAEMCDIWKAEWAGEENRVVCVLGAQAANSWTANAALNCELSAKKPCQSHHIDAVAIAPYFGYYIGNPANEAAATAWTNEADGGLGTLFAELEAGGQLAGSPAGGALAETQRWTAAYGNLARSRGLKLIAYEGGQHLAAIGNVMNNQAILNLLMAANRDPRMGELYTRLLNDWKTAGGDMFVHFNSTSQYGRYGSWGALENMLQTSTPKYDALMQFNQRNGL